MKSLNVSILALVIAIIALAVSFSASLTGQVISTNNIDFPTTTPIDNTMEFGEPEWQCFAQECKRFISGQEWVNQNCELNATGEFNCAVVINNQAVVVPLTAINVNTVTSCAETICTLEILTRAVNTKNATI